MFPWNGPARFRLRWSPTGLKSSKSNPNLRIVHAHCARASSRGLPGTQGPTPGLRIAAPANLGFRTPLPARHYRACRSPHSLHSAFPSIPSTSQPFLRLRRENRGGTFSMFFHEPCAPFVKLVLRFACRRNLIGNEVHHLPLFFRLAHHATDRLKMILVVRGRRCRCDPGPIADPSKRYIGKNNLRVPFLGKLLQRFGCAQPITNCRAQGRSLTRRLNRTSTRHRRH